MCSHQQQVGTTGSRCPIAVTRGWYISHHATQAAGQEIPDSAGYLKAWNPVAQRPVNGSDIAVQGRCGDYDEENGVCYLQILLADHISGFGKRRMFEDMDRWGYTFRLGSAQAWFEKDADDARAWLQQRSLIDAKQQPTWRLFFPTI